MKFDFFTELKGRVYASVRHCSKKSFTPETKSQSPCSGEAIVQQKLIHRNCEFSLGEPQRNITESYTENLCKRVRFSLWMFFVFLNGCQSASSNHFMFCSSKVERELSVFISVGSQTLFQSLFSDKGRIKQATCSRPLPFEKLLNGFKYKPLAVGVKTPNDFIKSRR